jgi:hypothetical protein
MRIRFFWVATLWAVWLWLVAITWVVNPSLPLALWEMPMDDAAISLGLRVAALCAAVRRAACHLVGLGRRQRRGRGGGHLLARVRARQRLDPAGGRARTDHGGGFRPRGARAASCRGDAGATCCGVTHGRSGLCIKPWTT